jgi:type IV pilus assembly protein PilC
LTKSIILVSTLLRRFWYISFTLVGLVVLAVRKIFKQQGNNLKIDRAFLKLPLFGHLFKKIIIARFVSTLGTLLRSGVTIMDALTVAKGVVTNKVIEEEIDKILQDVRAGRTMAERMYKSENFPVMVANMVATGEDTGRLPETLAVISDYYEEDVKGTVRDLFAVMEPVLIVVLGFFIGLIAVGMLLPILNMPEAF